MKHQYYLPKDDLGKAEWITTFASALATYAVALSVSPAAVASIAADADFFAKVILALPQFKDYVQTLTAYKNALRDGSPVDIGNFPTPPSTPAMPAVAAGIFNRVTLLVQNIKSNPAYTEAIGKALGIIGAEIPNDTSGIKPQPKVSLKNGHAYVQWHHEHTDAADLFADYGDGAGFIMVGRILTAHYLDPHTPAAGVSKVYQFKLRYVVGDEEVGVISDAVSVTVTG